VAAQRALTVEFLTTTTAQRGPNGRRPPAERTSLNAGEVLRALCSARGARSGRHGG
jgi:hypothetical protein